MAARRTSLFAVLLAISATGCSAEDEADASDTVGAATAPAPVDAETDVGGGDGAAAPACVLENEQVASAPADFLGDVGSTISLEITDRQEGDDGQTRTCTYRGALTSGEHLAVYITTYADPELPAGIFEAVGEPQDGYDFDHEGTHIRTSDDRAVANVHGTWYHVRWSYPYVTPDLFAARVIQQIHAVGAGTANASGSEGATEPDGSSAQPSDEEMDAGAGGADPIGGDEPACEVTGSFTSDAEGHDLGRENLDDIGAVAFDTYALEGSDGYEIWESYSALGTGSLGPSVSYRVVFYDGEVGYNINVSRHEDSPLRDGMSVTRFTEALEVVGGPVGENVRWEVPSDRLDVSGLALDGTGGNVSLLTSVGELDADPEPVGGGWYHPLQVELEFDCPAEAIIDG